MAKMATYIAGMPYRPGAKEHLAVLPQGQPLELKREPGNAHDRHAVAVWHGPFHLGYVPAVDARTLAAVMDRGITATAALSRLVSSTGLVVEWTA